MPYFACFDFPVGAIQRQTQEQHMARKPKVLPAAEQPATDEKPAAKRRTKKQPTVEQNAAALVAKIEAKVGPQPEPPKAMGISAKYKREHKPDALAQAIRAVVEGADGRVDLDMLKAVAVENSLEYRWGHLNPGQQVMCLSNVLRNRVKKGTPISLGGREFRA
jgi:hypothetical protein